MGAGTPHITIPPHLLPADGRFGSGPSKVPAEAVAALAEAAPGYLGTSHRRPGVRSVVGRVREGLSTLLGLPEGYEVLLGNGGATAFWDAAAFGLIETRSQHLSFGEFSSKFAAVVRGAPHLDELEVIESAPGSGGRGRRAGARRRHLGRRRGAGGGVRVRRLLLLAPEVLRLRWRAVA